MRPVARRSVWYGLATLAAGGLCYAGFVYELPPDAEHAITQAEIKLTFAAKMQARKADGSIVPAREAMLADAIGFIDAAEQLEPPTARSVEYRAFADYLRGDTRAAAAGYARARALATEDEQRGKLALCEAKMLAMTSDPGAVAVAREVLASGCSGKDLIELGQLLEALGRDDIAATAYDRAEGAAPIANYFRARLKAKGGDVDTALGMLECAVQVAGAEVRTLVEREPDAWRTCTSTERFRALFPGMAAAQPGR